MLAGLKLFYYWSLKRRKLAKSFDISRYQLVCCWENLVCLCFENYYCRSDSVGPVALQRNSTECERLRLRRIHVSWEEVLFFCEL